MPSSNQTAYPTPNPPLIQFPSRRSVVHSTNGMVACTQPLAAEAGQRILKMGGNAADAAVAVAAALNVTEPASTGIGGDMFCLFYDAESRTVRSINGSGRSAAKTSLESVRKELGLRPGETGSIPTLSALSITVPGAAAGWVDTVEMFGSGKVTMEQILMPAIELAEKGFPVSKWSSVFWEDNEDRIRNASPNFREILKRDPHSELFVRAPRPGELFRNPTLARTFRTLAKEGKDGFYTGRIAKAIVDVVQMLGGHLSLDDLKSHITPERQPTVETTPISIRYSGQGISQRPSPLPNFIELWEHPPNGQGLVALMALGIFQELESQRKILRFATEDHNSVPYLHAIIECLRIAFADGNWWICDPDPPFTPKAQPSDLTSSAYLAKRAKLYDAESVCDPRHGDPTAKEEEEEVSPALKSSDTVYFAVTDAAGNGASFINSIYSGFGTCIVPAGCGFPLQNRGSNFELSSSSSSTSSPHPNLYAPNKRPYHTIIPALLTTGEAESRALHAVYGVMGGYMQPQGHLQVLLNMEVFGMDPQTALDAPRICVGAAMPEDDDTSKSRSKSATTNRHHRDRTGSQGRTEKQGSSTVYVEEGIDDEVIEGLRRLGHTVQLVRGWNRGLFGRGQVIKLNVDAESGVLVHSGGSDGRGDGCAMPV